MKTRTIRQTVTIRAKPNDVYDALMTTRGHSAFTGASARISARVGGKFTAWDGYIQGRNVELVRGQRIVQEWKPREENWPSEYYSTVTYELSAIPAGTRLKFTHSGVPIEHAGHLAQGWKDHYWLPLKAYLEPSRT
jgi:activator of HSP90 ATPase